MNLKTSQYQIFNLKKSRKSTQRNRVFEPLREKQKIYVIKVLKERKRNVYQKNEEKRRGRRRNDVCKLPKIGKIYKLTDLSSIKLNVKNYTPKRS